MKRGSLLLVFLVVVATIGVWNRGTFRQDERGGGPSVEEGAEEHTAGATLHGRVRAGADGKAGQTDADGAGDLRGSAWRLEGRVVDLLHRPVGGVPVVRQGTREILTTSAADGAFAISLRQDTVALGAGSGWICRPVEVSREEPRATLQAVRKMTLQVVVLDEHGDPIPRVFGELQYGYVASTDESGSGSHSSVYRRFGPTDESGGCSLELAVSAENLELRVQRGNTEARAEVRFPFERRVVLQLRPKLSIQGVIVDRQGHEQLAVGWLAARPLDPLRAHETVELWVPRVDGWEQVERVGDDGLSTTSLVRTSSLGFTTTVLGPGPYLVSFDPADDGLARSEAVVVRAPATDVRLLCSPSVSVAGRVVGVGATRLRVSWSPEPGPTGPARPPSTVQTAADGAFRIEDLAPGAGRLFACGREDDRYALLDGVEAPLGGVVLRLLEGTSLSGRVVGEGRTGALRDAVIWMLVRAEGEGVHATARVGEDGRFRIRALPPGRYSLSTKWAGRWTSPRGWTPVPGAVDLDPDQGDVILTAWGDGTASLGEYTMDLLDDARLAALRANLLDGMRSYMADAEVDYGAADVTRCGEILQQHLTAVTQAKDAAAGLEAVRTTVLALNALNTKCDGELIETDQREDICAFIIRAGALRGFNEEGEDPTFEWREW